MRHLIDVLVREDKAQTVLAALAQGLREGGRGKVGKLVNVAGEGGEGAARVAA